MNVSVISHPHDRITKSCATMLQEVLDAANPQYVAGCQNLDPSIRGGIVVFHGQEEAKHSPNPAERINWFYENLKWIIAVSLGDEGCEFPYAKLDHPNMKLWVQTPKQGKVKADRYLIEGYHPNTHRILEQVGSPTRDLDWFFAGQISHSRRQECVMALRESNFKHVLLETRAFMEGMPLESYYCHMRRAKIVPCPAGPLTPDSFRFAEALEAGAVPILDAYSPDGVEGYWDMVLGSHPFFVIEDWQAVDSVMKAILASYEENQRVAQYWWKHYKLKMRTSWLAQDLLALGAL